MIAENQDTWQPAGTPQAASSEARPPAANAQADGLVRDYIVAGDLGLASPRLTAYHDVSLSFAQGRASAVVGESGSGRTELLLTLAGRMMATSGTLRVGSHDLRTFKGLNQVRRASGLAFFRNVNEVQPSLRLRTVTSAELNLAGRRSGRAAANAYLAEWGLADAAETQIEHLDRYTYVRAGIALAMASEPELLVVSDIESELTEHQSAKIAAELCELARTRGTTVVCGVTDYDVAALFDDAACITEDARAQAAAYARKHASAAKEVA